MIYLLFVPLAILTAWSIWKEGEPKIGAVLGVLFALALGIIIPLVTLANGSGLAKWQAFYSANAQNYEIAVDETASYLSADQYVEHALIPIEGSIERFKLTEAVSTRIAEWRDGVNKYNLTIASMKYFDGNIFTGVLVPDAVQDMKFLIIK